MLRILSFEELQTLTNEIPRLVDSYDKKEYDFSEKVKLWLKKLEKILENNRIFISGKIGTLRSAIIAAEHGVMTENIQFSGQPTRKKIKDATAMQSLKSAAEMLYTFLLKDYERFENANQQIRQLVLQMKVKNILTEFAPRDNLDIESLKYIWQVFRSDPDLAQGTIYSESLIGLYDSLIILNRQLSQA